MFCMSLYGVGTLVGGPIMGYTIDRIGSKNSVFLGVFMILLAGSCLFIYITINWYSWHAFLTTFLWAL